MSLEPSWEAKGLKTFGSFDFWGYLTMICKFSLLGTNVTSVSDMFSANLSGLLGILV